MAEAPVNAQALRSIPTFEMVTDREFANAYGLVASNIVSASNLEQTIQQIMDMGEGNWDKETVTCAFRATYNNPKWTVDYLYLEIPEVAKVIVLVARSPVA